MIKIDTQKLHANIREATLKAGYKYHGRPSDMKMSKVLGLKNGTGFKQKMARLKKGTLRAFTVQDLIHISIACNVGMQTLLMGVVKVSKDAPMHFNEIKKGE